MREHWSRFAIANKLREVGPNVTRKGGRARKKKIPEKNQGKQHTLSFLIVQIGQVEKIGSLLWLVGQPFRRSVRTVFIRTSPVREPKFGRREGATGKIKISSCCS